MMMTMEICSATRGSLTREDTIKANVVAKIASRGPSPGWQSASVVKKRTEQRFIAHQDGRPHGKNRISPVSGNDCRNDSRQALAH